MLPSARQQFTIYDDFAKLRQHSEVICVAKMELNYDIRNKSAPSHIWTSSSRWQQWQTLSNLNQQQKVRTLKGHGFKNFRVSGTGSLQRSCRWRRRTRWCCWRTRRTRSFEFHSLTISCHNWSQPQTERKRTKEERSSRKWKRKPNAPTATRGAITRLEKSQRVGFSRVEIFAKDRLFPQMFPKILGIFYRNIW